MSTISASTTINTAYNVTGDTTGTLVFKTGSGPTTAVTIDGSQNVGIGTSSPASKLNIVDASNTVNVRLESGSVIGQFFSSTSGGGVYLDANSSHPLVFRTAATERMRIDSSGNLLFNSGYGSVATAYGCRAWVTYTGSTATIRASGNVTSITRSATGKYTMNFTSAMPDANYSVFSSNGNGASYFGYGVNLVSLATGSCGLEQSTPTAAGNTSPSYFDPSTMCVSVFR